MPVTAHPVAIGNALETIAYARKALHEFPVKKIVIVYNECQGEFADDNAGYAALKALEAGDPDFSVTSIVLPLQHSEIWGKAHLQGMSFERVAASSAEELSAKFGMDVIACGRGKNVLVKWLERAVADFNEVGLSA